MTSTAEAGRRKGFRLDLNLCTGCGACAVACAVENELDWGTSWRFIETFNPRHEPGLPHHHLSLACNHCADAPCMNHCPALAYHRDDLTGAVLLDSDRCIGCRYCTWACPYDAPRFDVKTGVVSKCTFCHHRQLEGLTPACVGQCPTGALTFGDLSGLSGVPRVGGFEETAPGPAIRFEPLRPGGLAPPLPSEAPGPADGSVGGRGRGKTALGSEWPLVAFTLLAALAVGLMATPPGRERLGVSTFVALMLLAGGASTLHLGRKARAWRAVLNVRRSWLSREVAFFSMFASLGTLVLAGESPLSPGWLQDLVPTGLPTAAALAGFALLFAIDRVYAVTRTRGLAFHSARVLLTGLMVAGLAAGMPWLWGGAVAAKAVSFAGRVARGAWPEAGGWAAVRFGPGLIIPAGVLLAGQAVELPPSAWAASLALLAGGEIVDRCAFYLELDVPSGGVTRYSVS
ncbi:MAG TPA: DmsC/YnfH family molybdoenzyme membrane anchor subunit [Longimicrobiales bacterium]|nr:DmsC/YnfH family molybdoenzyme membrane anchor subunit [Longimicrobiales bacterium]